MQSWKTLTITFGLVLTLSTAHAIPKILKNYGELVTALESGNDVRAIVFLDFCNITTDSTNSVAMDVMGDSVTIDTTTRFNFLDYIHYSAVIDGKRQNIVSAERLSYLEQPNGSVLTELASINVYGDSSISSTTPVISAVPATSPTSIVKLRFVTYDAKNALQSTVEFQCGISPTAAHENGVVLYDGY